MKKKILIIASIDPFANKVRPKALELFLKENKFDVELYNTNNLSRIEFKNYSLNLFAYKILLRIIESIEYVIVHHGLYKKIEFDILRIKLLIRGKLLSLIFKNTNYDFIIIEAPVDSYFVKYTKNAKIIYDCPTPFADELYYEKGLSEALHAKFLKDELEIYSKATYLNFHWESYADYVKEKYDYKKDNIIKANWGCYPKNSKAKFKLPIKIVYLGYLGGYWIDLALLSRLSKIYQIDVYGSPKPPIELGLNYLGYGNPEILKNYQLGLITCTKDPLRRQGFSAKHIEYLSYGLPVLVPEWRTSAKKIRGTIFYNENNFSKIINNYKNELYWKEKHREAIKQSENLNWNSTLNPLLKILSS